MQPQEVFALALVIVGATLLGLPLVRALADRIRPRALDAGLREELQALREDLLAELQQTRRELGELHERVDFTERLLVKKTEQR